MTVHQQQLDWHDTPHPLGRHVEHDERSREFLARTAPLSKTPVIWTLNAKRLDQGRLGSCVPNAGSQCMNTAVFYGERRKLHRGRFLTEQNAIEWYHLVTVADNFPGSYPPDDTGSSGLAMAKVLKQLGWISSYQHAFGIDQALGALQLGPFITGTTWLNDMFNPDSNGVVPVSGSVAGGHEYLGRGWLPAGYQFKGHKYSEDMIIFSNSWSDSWGLGGDFLMPVSKYADLLKDQGDVTILTGSVS